MATLGGDQKKKKKNEPGSPSAKDISNMIEMAGSISRNLRTTVLRLGVDLLLQRSSGNALKNSKKPMGEQRPSPVDVKRGDCEEADVGAVASWFLGEICKLQKLDISILLALLTEVIQSTKEGVVGSDHVMSSSQWSPSTSLTKTLPCRSGATADEATPTFGFFDDITSNRGLEPPEPPLRPTTKAKAESKKPQKAISGSTAAEWERAGPAASELLSVARTIEWQQFASQASFALPASQTIARKDVQESPDASEIKQRKSKRTKSSSSEAPAVPLFESDPEAFLKTFDDSAATAVRRVWCDAEGRRLSNVLWCVHDLLLRHKGTQRKTCLSIVPALVRLVQHLESSAEDIVSGNTESSSRLTVISESENGSAWPQWAAPCVLLLDLFAQPIFPITDPESSPQSKETADSMLGKAPRGTVTKSLNGRMRVTGWAEGTSPTTTTPAVGLDEKAHYDRAVHESKAVAATTTMPSVTATADAKAGSSEPRRSSRRLASNNSKSPLSSSNTTIEEQPTLPPMAEAKNESSSRTLQLSKIAESPPHFEMLLDMETSSTLRHTILSLLKKSHVVVDCKSDAASKAALVAESNLLGRGDSERPSIQSIPSTLVAGCLQILTRLVRSAVHAREFVAANGSATLLALPSSAAFSRHTLVLILPPPQHLRNIRSAERNLLFCPSLFAV
jgi:hypothetical protein